MMGGGEPALAGAESLTGKDVFLSLFLPLFEISHRKHYDNNPFPAVFVVADVYGPNR